MKPNTGLWIFKAKVRTGTLCVLSLFAILGMLLTACGSANGTAQNAHSNALTAQVGPNGDFTRNFTPFTASEPTPGNQGLIYETLLYINQLNNNITPWLATAYNFSNGNKTLTFTLRQNVKWSDGQPFTSADVVFTLMEGKKYSDADINGLWNYITNVTAPDANTVVVQLKEAYTPILWYLGDQTYIVPQHLWQNVGDPAKYPNPNPVGTGPFVLSSFTPQLVDLKRNPNYWQPGLPKVNEIRYPSYNSNASLELDMDRGNLDWISLYTPNLQQGYVQRDPAHNKYWFAPGNDVTLFMNLTKAPFNNLALRKAISLVIDRNQISKVGETGFEAPASPTALILPNQQQFLNPQYENLSTQPDTSQATQLLNSAGFKKGSDGIYTDPSGKKLSFNLNVVSGWSDWVTDCQIIANELKSIGIQANVNAISYSSYINALQTGSFDTSIGSVPGGPTPFYIYQTLLSKDRSAPIGQIASSNYERWIDPTTQKLLVQYASTTDQATQQQALNGLQEIMINNVPAIPLVYGAFWFEYNTQNFVGWPDQSNQYAVGAPWQLPDAAVVLLHLKPAA
jgi:peptide/nickel transport system substrate-binding protein